MAQEKALIEEPLNTSGTEANRLKAHTKTY